MNELTMTPAEEAIEGIQKLEKTLSYLRFKAQMPNFHEQQARQLRNMLSIVGMAIEKVLEKSDKEYLSRE